MPLSNVSVTTTLKPHISYFWELFKYD